MNTLLTYDQQLKLVEQKLAVVSRNEELGLDTFKYHRRVMYDYLWELHPEVLECRGHTYDYKTGELVIAAPRKSFNYLENGWWKNAPMNTRVRAYKKFNGFMATMSIHKGQLIVGTTGSTKSDYVAMAKEHLNKQFDLQKVRDNWTTSGTWLFEIIHKNDPHIVHETEGAKYLGYRAKRTGEFMPVNCETVAPTYSTSLATMLEMVKKVRHEGFMLYDDNGSVCKLKSPYYVGKKKLMRMQEAKIKNMFSGKPVDDLPEMWYPVVEEVKKNFDVSDWIALDEQSRRKQLEIIYGD